MSRLWKIRLIKCIILGWNFNSKQYHEKLKQNFKIDNKFSGLIEFETDSISFLGVGEQLKWKQRRLKNG